MAPAARELRVVDVFLRYIKEERARVVFGIPGGLLHPFFEAVQEDPELRLVVTKHEQGAAFMADGYARAGRRLGVCAGTAGPGSTNLMTGVACAFADGVSMLVVTGQAASHALGKGAAQETNREDMDIVEMFRPVTKYSTMITSPASVAHHLRRALRLALTGRPGPVHLNLPVDLWDKPVREEWFDPKTYRPEIRTFDRSAVERAARTLLYASRPAILAGAGVFIARAEEPLRSLAELLSAKVATSPRGKGVFPEDHRQSLGILGFAGHAEARRTLLGGEADVLMTVGASLNETTTLNWNPRLRPSKALIQIDIDADRIGRNYPVDVPLVGDAQTILLEIVYHLHRLIREDRKPASTWQHSAAAGRSERFLRPELAESNAIPLSPARWRADLAEVLPDNATIVSDIGGHMLFNVHYLTLRADQRFVLNLGFGSMGHGTVSPIGIALAEPKRPVVAIVGDACFAMNGMELLTAVEYGVPVVWIVENNHMHGITWHGSKLIGSRRGLDSVRYRKPIAVSEIARAMGLHAFLVDSPSQLKTVFGSALSLAGPTLIEVRVDGTIPPPLEDRAKSLAGFVE